MSAYFKILTSSYLLCFTRTLDLGGIIVIREEIGALPGDVSHTGLNIHSLVDPTLEPKPLILQSYFNYAK